MRSHRQQRGPENLGNRAAASYRFLNGSAASAVCTGARPASPQNLPRGRYRRSWPLVAPSVRPYLSSHDAHWRRSFEQRRGGAASQGGEMGHRLIENSTWGPRRATILRFVSPVPQRSPKCRRDTEVRPDSDSPLEEARFEPSVPPRLAQLSRLMHAKRCDEIVRANSGAAGGSARFVFRGEPQAITGPALPAIM